MPALSRKLLHRSLRRRLQLTQAAAPTSDIPTAALPAGFGVLARRRTTALHRAVMSSLEGRRLSPKKAAPRQERGCDKVGVKALSAGFRLILDKGVPVSDADAAHTVLEPLHQGGGEITDAQLEEIEGWLGEGVAPYQATPDEMLHALRTAAKGSAPGPSGFSTRLWQRTLVENEQLLTKFTNCIGAFSGTLPANLRELWAACRSLALEKPDEGHRPISMGDVARRVTGRAALSAHRDAIQLRFRDKDHALNLQLGCMSRNSSENVVDDLTLRAAPQPHAPAHGHHQRVQHPTALRLPEGGEEALLGAGAAVRAVLHARVGPGHPRRRRQAARAQVALRAAAGRHAGLAPVLPGHPPPSWRRRTHGGRSSSSAPSATSSTWRAPTPPCLAEAFVLIRALMPVKRAARALLPHERHQGGSNSLRCTRSAPLCAAS